MIGIDANNAGERLKLLIQRLKMKQIRFAKKVGIPSGYVSQMINGHRGVTYEKALQIKNSGIQLNIEWLLHGEGEMFDEGKKPAPPQQKHEGREAAEEYRKPEGEKMVVDATELIRRMDALKEEVWRLGARVKYLEDVTVVEKG